MIPVQDGPEVGIITLGMISLLPIGQKGRNSLRTMSKRFIDTDLFKKPFMRSLEAPYKALWVYLLCECDHAGVWTVELDVAQLRMGMKLDAEKALEKMGGAAIAIDGGSKWFLPDFVAFQYGTLNPANRVHESVLAILSKYGIDIDDMAKNKPLASPLQGAKDKDKDKDTSEKKERASEVEIIPEGFTVEHWRAIQRWFTYREQSKKKLNPMSKEGFIKKWKAKGEAATIAAIDNSIEKGYQGCFEPDATQRQNGKLTDDQERAARFAHIATLYPDQGH